MGKKKSGWIALLLLAVLAAIALLAYQAFAPQPVAGEKTITVNVDHLEGEDTTFIVSTDAEYLRDALEQEGLVAGKESQYGLWIQTVDGETADEDAQQWWGFSVNGAFSDYGVDAQPVADGDVYDFVLNVGW